MMTQCKKHLGEIAFGRLPNGYARLSSNPVSVAGIHGLWSSVPDPCVSTKTFIRNHASALVACDFATVVTATFRTLYVLVVLEIGTRKILHCNVTAHPSGRRSSSEKPFQAITAIAS